MEQTSVNEVAVSFTLQMGVIAVVEWVFHHIGCLRGHCVPKKVTRYCVSHIVCVCAFNEL